MGRRRRPRANAARDRAVPHTHRTAETAESDLATVLFTDIVASTERSAALGNTAWRALLERHHALVRQRLGQFDGSEIDTAGDGFFGRFPGPAAGDRVRAHAGTGHALARTRHS